MTVQNMKLRAPVPFPAQVTGSGGIAVSKTNGVWSIEPDFSGLGQIAASAVTDPTTKEIWIFDPVSGEYNVLTLGALGDALYKLTSTTSLSIGTGSKTFTTQQNKDLGVGSWVLVVSDAAPATNFMIGQVTAYAGTSLTVNFTYAQGTGTHTDWTIRAASPPGSAGRSAGYSYAWLNATTASDPGAGNIKVNNATFASITAVYLSETDADGNGLAAEIATWVASTNTKKGRLKIYDPLTPSNFMTFDVTALTDNGAWDTLTVVPVSSGGAFTASLALRVAFSAAGDQGLHSSFTWKYSSTVTMADPGTGFFRGNNATLASVTQLAISALANDSGNPNIDAFLASWGAAANGAHRGYIIIRDNTSLGPVHVFEVTGAATDNATWVQVPVAYVAGSGSLTVSDVCAIGFTRSGDTGATGATGPAGVSAGVLWNFATSTTMADPGAGNVRLNSATLASVTAIAISATDANSGSQSAWVNTFDDSSTTAHLGYLIIKKVGAPQNFAIYDITGALTDNTTWLQLSVAYIGGGGSFSASDSLSVQFTRTGDAGSGTISGGTAHGVGIATGASSMTSTVAMTNGQLLVGQTGADPLPKSITGDGSFSAAGALTVTSINGVPVGTSGNAIPKLNTQNDWSGAQQYAAIQTLTDAASIAWDVSTRQKAKVTLGGNRTMNAVTNAAEGATYWLWVIQDATGSRTLSWTTTGAGSFDFGADGAPTLTTTASKADLLCFEAISIGGTLKLRFCGIKKAFT